jgi:hypothetical protein
MYRYPLGGVVSHRCEQQVCHECLAEWGNHRARNRCKLLEAWRLTFTIVFSAYGCCGDGGLLRVGVVGSLPELSLI